MGKKEGRMKSWLFVPLVVGLAVVGGYFTGYLTLSRNAREVQAQQQPAPQISAQERSSFNLWQNVFRNAVKQGLPAVVQINVVGYQEQATPWFDGWPKDFFGEGLEGEQSRREFRALGSGVIVRRTGNTYYVLTNQHVVNNAEEIEVVTYDDKSFVGKVIGQDNRLDLGLVSIEVKDVPLAVALLGNSEDLQIGDWVMSIGSPFGFKSSVTAGIISFVGRHGGPQDNISDFIQTDASINRGNSGGALINMRGEVIGINTWISSSSAQVSAGVGFAIPINTAKRAIDQFIDRGKIEYGWLGVSLGYGDIAGITNRDLGSKNSREILEDLSIFNRSGAFVSSVYTDSPAAKGSMRPGDFIIEVNGVSVDDPKHLTYLVGTVTPGEKVKMKLLRGGSEVMVDVKIAKRESDDKQASAELLWPGVTGYPLVGDVLEKLRNVGGGDIRSRQGLYLLSVSEGSLFDLAGLKMGDVLLEINGQKVKTLSDFYRIVGLLGPRDKFNVSFDRGGAKASTSTFTIR